MGMSYGVYIGPFLQCAGASGREVDITELTDDRLTWLRGELSSEDGGVEYFGPNVKMPAIERQMRFDRWRDAPVVMRIDQAAEMAAFHAQFAEDIQKVREAYDVVSVEWGVVPSFS